MMNMNLARMFCLMLFAWSAVSPAQVKEAEPITNSAIDHQSPGALESIPRSPIGIAAEPLRVVCKGNELTVAANNSTLGSILNEIQKCTGAKIDIPNGAAEIRFYDTIGPLPVREVLSTLLTATGYNFVIQSSDSESGKVESVLLMAGTVASPLDPAGDRRLTTARRAFLKMRQDALTEAGITDDASSSTAVESSVPAAAQPTTADGDGASPGTNSSSDASQAATTPPSAAAPAENATSSNPTPSPAVAPSPSQTNTVEDQITNMQQMFEQRRQMMQPKPSTPPQ